VRGAELPAAGRDVGRQRLVVDAFLAAARRGDLEGLVAVLQPDVVLRVDYGPKRPAASTVVRGAAAVAAQAKLGALPETVAHPALVEGAAGVVITLRGRPYAVMGFTVRDGRSAEIDIVRDADRVRRVASPVLVRDGRGIGSD
jgi:RNA polymerase sigma-70 factor (ECF subfamily)